MAVVGIVPAAGRGERLGSDGPKAFVACGGRPLVEWSLDVLEAVCDRVVMAVPEGWETGEHRVTGGAVRSASVRAALAAAPEATVVVVQDAARPLLTRELVERCVEAIESGWEGAIAAARMTDTVKEADESRRVVRTLDRSVLWRIQTPQAFDADTLRRALDVPDEVLAAATDDASLVEAAGGSVCVVEAPQDNIKVTTQLDLELAAALLGQRERRL
jgi:2-C-methyl-D-erythritol 4-phosphate cytidylyltransferase